MIARGYTLATCEGGKPPSIPLFWQLKPPKKLSDSQRKEKPQMNRTRPKQIVIRVSEEELMQIKKKVEQSGKNQQEYIIEALTQPTITNTDGIKELIPELKRIGNNLNQIAHALNEKGYYSYNLITENQKELGQLWQSLRQFLQK